MPEDNVAEILRSAHEAVKASGVPAGLHSVAFEKAVDLLAVEAGLTTAGAAAGPPVGVPGPAQPAAGGEEKTLDRIAAQLKAGRDAVGEVYHVDGDDLQLSLAPSRFASGKGPATREIALLVAAGRQAGGWDTDWTESSVIRQICDNKGKLDDANFAATLRRMGEVFGFSGSGQSLKVKVNREGKEHAAALILGLAGGEAGAA
jgi:hypothetical protein